MHDVKVESKDTFVNSNDWDKLGSFFGIGGIRRMIVQLLGQLDGSKLHWRKHAKRQEKWRIPMPSLV